MDRSYQLYELKQSIEMGVVNGEKTVEMLNILTGAFKDSKDYETVKPVLGDFENSLKGLEVQLPILKDRLDKINTLIEWVEAKDEKSEIVVDTISLFLEAIGAAVDPTQELEVEVKVPEAE